MTGRKKSVSRQKSGGRQKDTKRAKPGATKKAPVKTLKITPKIRRDKEGHVSFKSKRDSIQTSTAYDPDYHFSYSKEVPIFTLPMNRPPPDIMVDGGAYVDTFKAHTHLGEAFNEVALLYRIGYDAVVVELTGVPDDASLRKAGWEDAGRYAVYRSADYTDFKLKPQVGGVSDKLRDTVHTGGWSSNTNGMLIDAGRGPERVLFKDKLGQLLSNIKENEMVASVDIAGRLSDYHVARDRPETEAFIEIKWADPIRQEYVLKSMSAKDLNEVTMLGIHQSVETVFGQDAVYVENANFDDPTHGRMLLKVQNKWEPGHALHSGEYRYGALRDIRKKHGAW